LISPKYWLVLGTALWVVCAAGQPPAQAPPPQPGKPVPNAPSPPPSDIPDEEFIEFLGEDDHGDTAWWEFLKKAPPGQQNPATPPPQGAKQS
jgi:hypothetical protein